MRFFVLYTYVLLSIVSKNYSIILKLVNWQKSMVYPLSDSCTQVRVRPKCKKNESTFLSLHIFKLPHLARWASKCVMVKKSLPHYSLPRAHPCSLSRDLASRLTDARRRSSSLMVGRVFCWQSCIAACSLGWSDWRNLKPRWPWPF